MKKLLLTCFAAVCCMVNVCAQEWETLETEAWAFEWRTMSEKYDGPAQTDETGAYKVHVRSEAQARAAGNMPENDNKIAAWDTQFIISFGKNNALEMGDVLSVTFQVKADAAVQIPTQSHRDPGSYLHWFGIGDVEATTSWQTISREVTVTNANGTPAVGTYSICFNLADGNENNIYFKDIEVKVKRAAKIVWKDIIINGDLTGNDMSCFYQKVYPETEISQSSATDGVIVINSPARVENEWDTQFFVRLPQILPNGTKFRVTFDCKASKNVTVKPLSHAEPGGYLHYDCVGDVDFTTEWQTFETCAVVGDECEDKFQTIAFNLSQSTDVTYYFKNFKVEIPADDGFDGYTLVRSVTFGDGTLLAGTETCTYTAYCPNKQQALTVLTAPEAAAGWIALCSPGWNSNGWKNVENRGLCCISNRRSACVFGDDLTLGWLVVFECTQNASNVLTLTNADGNPDGTFNYTLSEDGMKYICTITKASDAHVGFCGVKNQGYIKSISVYKPNNPVVITTYTVKYEDMDGNTLKEAVIYDAVSGAPILLSDYDKSDIIVGDDTYVYDSDDIGNRTVAEDGSTVVTVKFHKAKIFNYTVNEVCAGTIVRTTNSFNYETATVVAPYRKYNAVDGQLYKKDVINKEYNYRFTLTEEDQEENIDYSAVDGVDNVVFITEGEDVDGLTPCNTANTSVRSSNSASAYADNDTKIVSLGAGTYKLHAIIYDCSNNPDSHWIFMAGEEQIADFNCTIVNIQEFDSEEFTLTEETDIIMAAAGNNKMGLDALYITGESMEGPGKLPEGLRAWDWELKGQLSDGDFHTDAQVAFDGTDVYLRGLSSINEEAWIKGTLDTETNLITFPCGQYVGLDADDPIYLVGLSYKNFCDIVFEYDVYAQTLTQVTPAILENGNTRTLDVRYYWTDVILKSKETVSFTVRYVDEEDNEIKPSRIGWGEIGGKYDMHGSDHDPIYSDDGQTKYKYTSMIGDYHYLYLEPENNIITLVFRKGSLCYTSVNCMSNGYFELLAKYEETFYDCDELTIHLPWGLRDSNGRCFFTSSNTGENNHGRNVTFPSNYEPTVRYGKTYYTAAVLYNEDPSVAYYADCATLILPPEGNEYGKGLGQIDGSYRVRENGGWSLGNTISLREDSYLWTEPIAEAGTYRVAIHLHKAFTKATDEPFVFGYRDADGNKFIYTDLNIPAYGEGYYVDTNITENVSIPAGASLIVMNRLPENEVSLDDITLYKTGDFVEPIADGIQDLKDSKDFKDSKVAIYNLAGQRLNKMQKGINIVGGKKILVK